MSFECYYDHNKQQFIHKTELILIAAVAVGLSYGLHFCLFFFLFYINYMASKSCGVESSQRAHGPQYGFRRMSFDLCAARDSKGVYVLWFFFRFFLGLSRSNIMLITAWIKCVFRCGNFGADRKILLRRFACTGLSFFHTIILNDANFLC